MPQKVKNEITRADVNAAYEAGRMIVPLDAKGKSSITSLILDAYREARQLFPNIVTIPDLRKRWYTEGPFEPLRAFIGPWMSGLHQTEVARLQATPEDRKSLAEFLLNFLSQELGADHSLQQAIAKKKAGQEGPSTHEVFNPANFTLKDLMEGGIRVLEKDRLPVLRFPTSDRAGKLEIQHLFDWHQEGIIALSGQLEKLLKFYDQTMTLNQVVADVNRIKIQNLDVNAPEGRGFEPQAVMLSGEKLTGEALLWGVRDLFQPDDGRDEPHVRILGRDHPIDSQTQVVNGSFVQVVEAVIEQAKGQGGKITLVSDPKNGQTGERVGTNQPQYLVGTGLAGEIANKMVEAFFRAGGYVYMPDLTLAGSKVSAALVAKTMAAEQSSGADTSLPQEVTIYGGALLVDAADGLNPGLLFNKIDRVVPPGVEAYFAGMMYVPGSGNEILAEISQFALARALQKAGIIRDSIRLESPARPGKEIGSDLYRSDTTYFQGPSYNVAQLIKVWASEVLNAPNPTAFITATRGMMNDLVTKLLPFAPAFKFYPAWDTATTGSFLALILLALIEANRTGNEELRKAVMKACFDGNITQLPEPLQDILIQAQKALWKKQALRLVGKPVLRQLQRMARVDTSPEESVRSSKTVVEPERGRTMGTGRGTSPQAVLTPAAGKVVKSPLNTSQRGGLSFRSGPKISLKQEGSLNQSARVFTQVVPGLPQGTFGAPGMMPIALGSSLVHL